MLALGQSPLEWRTGAREANEMPDSNTRVVQTASDGCPGQCQVLVHLEGDKVVEVTGDRESPVSRGYGVKRVQLPRSCSAARTG